MNSSFKIRLDLILNLYYINIQYEKSNNGKQTYYKKIWQMPGSLVKKINNYLIKRRPGGLPRTQISILTSTVT